MPASESRFLQALDECARRVIICSFVLRFVQTQGAARVAVGTYSWNLGDSLSQNPEAARTRKRFGGHTVSGYSLPTRRTKTDAKDCPLESRACQWKRMIFV